MSSQPQKIAVIGNSGGGKTELSKKLAQKYQLPLVHVDAIQFLPGMRIKPHKDSIAEIKRHQEQATWVIDGYGPLDIFVARLELADQIVFIDFPLWRHYWWCTKRQIKNIWSRREELPQGCNELTLSHTIKLYKNLWKVHQLMRPELLRILGRDHFKSKLVVIHNVNEWRHLALNGIIQ